MEHEAGITAHDLPRIYREAYVDAIHAARRAHDPCDDWDGFVASLWRALVPAFGLDAGADEGDSGGVPQ